jgi:hypothetical protein
MLLAQGPDAVIHSVVSIACGIVAFIAAELTRRYATGRRDGEADAKSTLLAQAFEEFKETMGDALREIKSAAEAMRKEIKSDADAMRLEIKADFSRVYDLMGRSHICHQEQIIGEMKAQITTNTERFLRMEQRVHELEGAHAARIGREKDGPGK